MNEEEKFDELLRSKLSEREFPMDDLNWDEAEQLINKQERWSKISRISLVFSAGLAAGIIIMLPFILSTHPSLPDKVASKSNSGQNLVSSNNISIPANQLSKKTTDNAQNGVKLPMPVQSAFVKRNMSTGTRVTSDNLSLSDKVPKKNSSYPTSIREEKTQVHHQVNADVIVSAGTINTAPAITDICKSKDSDAEIQAIVNPRIDENILPPNNINRVIKIDSLNAAINTNTSSFNNSDSNTYGSTDRASPNSDIRYIITKTDSSNATRNPMIPGTSARHDTAKYSSNILSVYAGANYSFGWNTNGTQEASGMSFLGGLNYTHYFSKTIAASLGLGYSELNNLDKTYTSSTIQYDFGANTQVITVEPRMVYYLSVPLNFQYNIDSKDGVSLGFDYLIMLTTSSTLNSYNQTYFGVSPTATETENGYTQGFSNYDFQITISYTRMITKRLGICLEGYWGFISVENSSFPGNTQSEMNKGGRLVLSYQLVK
jgi:hypothetical protein